MDRTTKSLSARRYRQHLREMYNDFKAHPDKVEAELLGGSGSFELDTILAQPSPRKEQLFVDYVLRLSAARSYLAA